MRKSIWPANPDRPARPSSRSPAGSMRKPFRRRPRRGFSKKPAGRISVPCRRRQSGLFRRNPPCRCPTNRRCPPPDFSRTRRRGFARRSASGRAPGFPISKTAAAGASPRRAGSRHSRSANRQRSQSPNLGRPTPARNRRPRAGTCRGRCFCQIGEACGASA